MPDIIAKKDYSKPKSGKFYTVENGMDLLKVSIFAYGYDKTALIINANTILQSRPLDPTLKLPLIYQDENIWIPKEAAEE